MTSSRNAGRFWLMAVVLAHLVISAAHGSAHDRAKVPLSTLQNLFVYGVILAGPLLGLLVTFVARRTGAWIVAATMAGALLFGIINHFVLSSPDHISQVDPQWQSLFAITAVLLSLTEAAGVVLGVRAARNQP